MSEPAPASPPVKSPLPKVAADSLLAGSSAGAVAWLWNGFVGEPQMPAEVAGLLAGLLGPVIGYLISWLPRPRPPTAALAALAALPLLGACAFVSEQQAAGLTTATVVGERIDEQGRVVERCRAEVKDGKQRQKVALGGTVCGSSFLYQADEIEAFRAFDIRKDAEKASTEVLGRIVPEVVDTAVSAGLRAFVGTSAIGAARDAVAAKAALDAAKLKAETLKAAATGAKPGGAP